MHQLTPKGKVRKRQRSLRDALSEDTRAQWDNTIFERLTSLDEVQKAQMIMCYVSCRTEVDTHRFIKWRLGNSGQISVPRVDLVYKAIVASEIEDFAHDLHVGHFKILEPIHERVRLVAPEEIDLYIVPGVAFDRRGFRLGYGKGYYDAYLKKVAHDPIKIGLAYHPQLIDSIPESPWDIPVDMIITNEDVIVCNGIYKKEV